MVDKQEFLTGSNAYSVFHLVNNAVTLCIYGLQIYKFCTLKHSIKTRF